jgi:hypothetical protein
MSKVDDLISIAAAMKRSHKARGYVVQFAKATGTLHAPTNKIVWPEFEREFMAQRARDNRNQLLRQAARRVTRRPQEPLEQHPLVRC